MEPHRKSKFQFQFLLRIENIFLLHQNFQETYFQTNPILLVLLRKHIWDTACAHFLVIQPILNYLEKISSRNFSTNLIKFVQSHKAIFTNDLLDVFDKIVGRQRQSSIYLFIVYIKFFLLKTLTLFMKFWRFITFSSCIEKSFWPMSHNEHLQSKKFSNTSYLVFKKNSIEVGKVRNDSPSITFAHKPHLWSYWGQKRIVWEIPLYTVV